MRNYYEETLHIRETKYAAADAAYETVLKNIAKPEARTDKKVAVIGGGPAGLSAAMFLSRAGVPVTVFEKSENLGGVVRNVIPDFRIKREDIEKDVALCKAYGAEFVTGKEVASIKALKEEDEQYRSIFINIIKKNNATVIKIENYCSKGIEFEDGMPKSKQDNRFHGFGTKSIEYIAKKYNGQAVFNYKNNVFSLTICFFN